ncbi:MAG: peptide deformylase [Bacteroidales bacterium]
MLTAYEAADPQAKDFKKAMINPEIIEESGDDWLFNEGCLSIPISVRMLHVNPISAYNITMKTGIFLMSSTTVNKHHPA